MTETNTSTPVTVHPVSLPKRLMQGALLAFILITIFLLTTGKADPTWGKFWMIRPVVIVTAAGAVGGAFYYFMDLLCYQGGWKKIVAIALSVVVYIFGLWIGTILGFDGTMWD